MGDEAPDRMRHFRVEKGLATLGPEAVRLVRLLDRCFLVWADELQAAEMFFPPVVSVADLERLGYFHDFPRQGALVSRLRAGAVHAGSAARGAADAVAAEHLDASGYALTPAACYGAYLFLADSVVGRRTNITALAQCFRHQEPYEGPHKLFGFTQRKIVYVGTPDAVKADLAKTERLLIEFAAALDLTLTRRPAASAFDPASPRALVHNLFAPDMEFAYEDDLVVGHTNFHRTHYSQRCDIRTPDNNFASAGCAGLVHEYWLVALLRHYGEDWATIRERLAAYLTQCAHEGRLAPV